MHRHEAQHEHPCSDRHVHDHGQDHGHGQALARGRTHRAADVLQAKITGMDCGSCALTIEDGLRALPGVRRVAVDFTTESIEVEGDVSRDAVEHRLRQLGYGLAAAGAPARSETAPRASGKGALRFFFTQPHQRLAVFAGAACIVAAVTAHGAPAAAADSLLRLVLIATVALVGGPTFIKGVRALLYGRRVSIDLLMTLAAIGALFIGAAGEGAAVVVLFTLGEGLERYSAARARDSLRSLLDLQPQTASLLERHGGHTHIRQVAAALLAPGDVILVKPGERIAADGIVRTGRSTVDQAAVTGESSPLEKGAGDEVLSGTINAEGALEVEVARAASDSIVARIARLVEQAQARRSPAERVVDRFARWYTPAVALLAILLVAVPVLGFSQPLTGAPGAPEGWLYRGLALLIVACPCALVISIPVTVVSSLTRLSALGVLVKGGEQLDRLAAISTVAFDKTGTLTRGRPSVTAIQASGCGHEPRSDHSCGSCDDLIALAASVERSSEHPIARAIMESACERGLQHRYPPASAVVASLGRGVVGEVAGSKVAVGTAALMRDHGAGAGAEALSGFDPDRDTVMMVARNSRIVGAIGVRDALRTESRAVLEELRRESPRLRTALLSGDSARAAQAVASALGHVDEVRAGLLPADKLAAVAELQRSHGPIAMIGDGINDAPALAQADVGVAMGGGTGQAMETADVVLMRGDLVQLPSVLRVARRNRAVVRQNIAISLGLKLAFVALTIPGLATLWLAVVADVGATVLVTLNGMRMLRAR